MGVASRWDVAGQKQVSDVLPQTKFRVDVVTASLMSGLLAVLFYCLL